MFACQMMPQNNFINVQSSFNEQHFKELFRSPLMQQYLVAQSQQLSQSQHLYEGTFPRATSDN